MPDIPNKLRELMRLCNMSQARLSEKSQISKTQISNILTGKSIPKIDTLEMLCKALDCNLSCLFLEKKLEYTDDITQKAINKNEEADSSNFTAIEADTNKLIGSKGALIEAEDLCFEAKRQKALKFVINASPVVLNLFLEFAEAVATTDMCQSVDKKEK